MSEEYIRIEDNLGELKPLIDALKAPRPLLEQIGRRTAELVRKSILAERSPGGKPMQPLSPLTIQVKRGSKILRDTGQLFNSFNYQISSDSVNVGTAVEYAPLHQHGATITPRAGQKYILIPVNFEARQWLKGAGGTSKAYLKRRKFIKKKQVKIPARPFIPEADITQYPEYINMLENCIKMIIEKGKEK